MMRRPANSHPSQIVQVRMVCRPFVGHLPVIAQDVFDFRCPSQRLAVGKLGLPFDEHAHGERGEHL